MDIVHKTAHLTTYYIEHERGATCLHFLMTLDALPHIELIKFTVNFHKTLQIGLTETFSRNY